MSNRWRKSSAFCCALCATTALASNPFPYFGYYDADTEVYGHYMDKVVIQSDGTRLQDYTNLMLIDVGHYGQADPRRAIIDATNLGYKILLYGASGFDYTTPQLWSTGLAEFQSAIHGYESSVFAIDLVDEPDGRGWNRTQMESLASQAKAYFHNSMPITMNLDNPTNVPSPRNLDQYMFDYYVNGGGTTTTKAQYDATSGAIISAINTASGGKPILMLGSSFTGEGFGLPTATQEQWYFDTALNTPQINGLMWFLLANNAPTDYGAISFPSLLSQHKQMASQVLVPKPGLVTDERVDSYASQADVAAVYSGTAPILNIGFEHGNNGGKSFRFGPGAEMATRIVSVGDKPGSVEAFVYDSTAAASDDFGFRAVNSAGKTIAIYARGGTTDFLVDDEGNGVVGLDSQIPSISHWQKVEFTFDGAGIRVYADSQLVYLAPGGWAGGYNRFGFYDPFNSNGVGYVDDIRPYQNTVAPTSQLIGSNQTIDLLALNTRTVNVGLDGSGNHVPAIVNAGSIQVTGGGLNALNTIEATNSVTSTNLFAIDANTTLTKRGAGALTINGAQQHGSGALLIINAGTVNVNCESGSLVYETLNVIGNGGVIHFNTTQHLASLRLNSGGSATLAAGQRILVTRALSFSGNGKLDLADNFGMIDYTGDSPLASLRAALLSGYNGGSWTGAGIMSSSGATVAANPSNLHKTGFGYAEASQLGVTTFSGEFPDSTSLLIRYTYFGDADLNGAVNTVDFNNLAGNFNQSSRSWYQGDFNYDGAVNTIDFNFLASNFGQVFSAPAATTGQPIPEASTALLLAATGSVVASRRRELRPEP